jgi:hypothetical protein
MKNWRWREIKAAAAGSEAWRVASKGSVDVKKKSENGGVSAYNEASARKYQLSAAAASWRQAKQ